MTTRREAIAKARESLNKIYEDHLRPRNGGIGGTYSEPSEEGHMEADEILCDLVLSLMDGDRSLVDRYRSIGKWYA